MYIVFKSTGTNFDHVLMERGQNKSILKNKSVPKQLL